MILFPIIITVLMLVVVADVAERGPSLSDVMFLAAVVVVVSWTLELTR